MKDQFNDLVVNANKYINQVKTDLNTRESLKAAAKPTGRLDAEINGGFKHLGTALLRIGDYELDQIDQQLREYHGHPGAHNLLGRELQRRGTLYAELQQQRLDLRKRME